MPVALASKDKLEIEITPEMIAAGGRMLSDCFDIAFDWFIEEKARDVFLEMISVSNVVSARLSSRPTRGPARKAA